MSYRALRITEYQLQCDICGVEEVLHNFDTINNETVNSNNVFRLSGYHRLKGLILCDNCFAKEIKRCI